MTRQALEPCPGCGLVEPRFFATPAAFRRWLQGHHATDRELLVGFWKVGSGLPSMTWAQSVDEALCFGWIDGVRRGRDEDSYTIRFTPRRKRSTWSVVNTKRAKGLLAAGRMAPAGRRAFEERDAAKTKRYAYERERAAFTPAQERAFRAHPQAWAWFSAQAPSYRHLTAHWVTSAKQPATRERRLAKLIALSERGERPKPFVPRRGKGSA